MTVPLNPSSDPDEEKGCVESDSNNNNNNQNSPMKFSIMSRLSFGLQSLFRPMSIFEDKKNVGANGSDDGEDDNDDDDNDDKNGSNDDNSNSNSNPDTAASITKARGSGGLQPLDAPPKRRITDPDDQEPSDETENLQRLLRAAVISNGLLWIGGFLFIAFVSREIITFCRRDLPADILYSCAAGSFFISGSVQFFIDVVWSRTIATGRYSTNKWLNIGISLLFLWGVIADVVAFLFWRDGEEGVSNERRTQWVGSHLWLVASIISILTNLKRSTLLEDKMDVLGNVFFLWESVMNVCARYVSDITPAPGDSLDSTELRFELAAAVFWTCNAFFYLCGDAIRIHKLRQEQEGSRPDAASSSSSSQGMPQSTSKNTVN